MRTAGANKKGFIMNTPKGGNASASGQRKKLPVKPSLEHLQKQAKRQAKQSGLQLAAAQHQIAHEYGCKNWAELAHVVETMLRGADQLAFVKRKVQPLPQAARDVDIAQVRAILDSGDFTPHDLDQALGNSLWYGDESGWEKRKEIADLLLEHGADPDGQYGSGYGPLVFGTGECQQPAGLQYLIEAGADVAFAPIDTKYGKQCPMSHTLGSYVRGRNERKHRMIDILLRHGAYVPPEVTPPILAIHRGDAKTLGQLVERDGGLLTRRFADMPYGNIPLRGATLLHCAVEFGEIECVEELLKHYVDVNIKADMVDGLGGQTPIFHAVHTNCDDNFAMLEYLAKRVGVRIDMTVKATWPSQPIPMTPLQYAEHAVKTGDPQWRKKAGEELSILRSLDRSDQMTSAIRREDTAEVARLLDEWPQLLNPSLWPVAIFQTKSLAVTKLLLDRGLSPDECSAPRKPLHLAVYQCLPDIVEVLLARGATPDLLNPLGERPLDLLDAYEPRPVGDSDARRIRAALVAAGAREDFESVVRSGDADRVREALERDPALAKADSELGGPLFVAARSGRPAVVRLLLEHGADANGTNSMTNTPLWFAAQSPAESSSRIEVAKILLDAGADIHRICEDGSTALHFAAWRGPVAMVEFLLSRGARNWVADNKEKLPVDYARSSVSPDKDEIVKLFTEVRVLNPLLRSAVAAIDAGDAEGLKKLLQENPELVHQRAEEEGWFAGPYFRHPMLLHFVANNPYRNPTMPPRILETTKVILEAGAKVDAETEAENRHTTLGLVTSCEPARKDGLQIPLIEMLVAAGADPARGLDPAIVHGEMAAVECLLKLGAKHTLKSAAALGEVADLERLLAGKPSPNDILEAACEAAKQGKIPALEVLHAAGFSINDRRPGHPYAPTILHEAAHAGRREAAEWLLERGADPNIRDRQFDGTPAGWAEYGGGHHELAAWLKTKEKSVDEKIEAAVYEGDLRTLQKLLDAHPDKLALTIGPWNKPLLHMAAWRGHLALVRELVKRGADIHARCESDHACPIHFAAGEGHLDVVRYLADLGSTIEAPDNDHEVNVLGWATIWKCHEEVARFLLSRGATHSIWSAIALNDGETVRALVEEDPALLSATLSRNEYFRTPLHHAVMRNRSEMVRLLLDLGADPAARDSMGLSLIGASDAGTDPAIFRLLEERTETLSLHDALTLGRFDKAESILAKNPATIKAGGAETNVFVYAVCRKNWQAAEWLLDHGADIDAVAEVYQCPATALHFAVESAPPDKVQWLLDRGADTTIKDGKYDADAMNWSDFFGKADVAAMIRKSREAQQSKTHV